MKALLWIILAGAFVGVGLFALYTNNVDKTNQTTSEEDGTIPGFGPEEPDFESIDPPATPEFECTIEPAIENEKDVIYITVRETHGWYADMVQLEFWHQKIDDLGMPQRDSLKVSYLITTPIQLNDSVTQRVVPRKEELQDTFTEKKPPDLDFGTAENWGCEVIGTPYVRAPKPE